MRLVIVLVIAGSAMLSGCTSQNVKRGLYDALRVHNDLQSTPSERVGRPDAPTYTDYERMKKEQTN